MSHRAHLPATLRVAGTALAVVAAMPLLAGAQRGSSPLFHERFVALASQKGLSDSARLDAFLALAWETRSVEHPEFATYTGYPGQDDRWTDASVAAVARRERELTDPLVVLRAVNRSRLNPADQLSYDIFKRGAEEEIEGTRFPDALLQITQRRGPQYLAATLASMPTATVQHYENIVARIAKIAVVIEQTIVLLDSGRVRGITPPRITLRDVPAQLVQLTPDSALASPLLAPFARFPSGIAESDRSRLRAAATRAYVERARPAYRRLHAYLVGTYIPGCRESVSRSVLPDGKAWYAYDVKRLTTLSRTPAEIHELGLSEVKRIRSQMDSVMRAMGFTGNFAAFSAMLRTDPRFFY